MGRDGAAAYPVNADFSGQPLTSPGAPATSDFSPNATAGAGALLRGAGGTIPTQSVDNIDIGGVQHADPAGGAASILGGGALTGGFA